MTSLAATQELITLDNLVASARGGELYSAVGVEFETMEGAPSGEGLRFGFHFEGDGPAFLHFANIALSFFKPGVICSGEFVGIRHHLEDAGVVLPRKPDSAEGGNSHASKEEA